MPYVFMVIGFYFIFSLLKNFDCLLVIVELQSGAVKLSREGFVMLQFAPAAGVRQYDWSRKQVITLKLGEGG